MNMSTQKYVQMGVLALLYHMLGIFSIIEGTITVHDLMEPKKHETFEHFCEIYAKYFLVLHLSKFCSDLHALCTIFTILLTL